MLAGEAGRHVVGFLDFFIDVFMEVQNKRYSKILYLIDYIAYGLHLWYKILVSIVKDGILVSILKYRCFPGGPR